MFRREEFTAWLQNKYKNQGTINTHLWYVTATDKAFNLDEKLTAMGTDSFLEWTKNESCGPFEKYPSNTRNALCRYVEFSIGAGDQLEPVGELEGTEAVEPLLFQLEKEMQSSVRKQLKVLEPGLVIADDGHETTVATGKIDILARGLDGSLVVIELKAGLCPSSALEQVLGYADALAQERSEAVRAYLIAGQFSERTKAAAKLTLGLKLRTYEFTVRFNEVSQ